MNEENAPQGEKLQKILARAGFGSRRSVEEIIQQGLVKVNGKTAKLGDRATAADKIKVRDQLIREQRLQKQATEVILYNKPEGRVCTRKDEKDRQTIFAQLPRIPNGRWISIGRLDLNTSGLLILTNNGELANRMMHPSYEIEREYLVRVFGEVSDEIIKQLQAGVQLDDGPAKFDRVQAMPSEDEVMNRWYRVVLKEGRNREVRRIWEAVGLQVSRLHRVRYGQFSLPRNLRKGKTEALTWKQVNQLLKSVDLPEESRPDLRTNNSGRADKSALSKRDASKSARTQSGRYGKKTVHDLNDFSNPYRKKKGRNS
ncbi:23S rRNA pseudouridine(2605) synthase RluB [Thiomicrorhabdus sp.]|uniref:23S rRNA pseudouridine(2605) synthase RluB n=1 Tax=Thiomicrorhabdus sp. TaxID=2039724 RepID=UPI0029C921AD|nr:pseudouridine synthase [Thiomicrorhabdus sp.]